MASYPLSAIKPNPSALGSTNVALRQPDDDDVAISDDSVGKFLAYSSAEDVHDGELFQAVSIKHKQAALLLRKGYDNEKIASPVTSRFSELAYNIVHHPAYLWFNFLTALGLMLLVIGENPNDKDEVTTVIKVVVGIELVLLFLLMVNLVFRLVWLEPKLFLQSRGPVIAIIILVMVIEGLIILGTGNRHGRYTRALRPFLLLDTFLMSGVRRCSI